MAKTPHDGQEKKLPALENGDHLDQPTFHARYEAMPSHVQAELIGGIVYLWSLRTRQHGGMVPRVISWLANYEEATPGTEALARPTVILGPVSEPQPDCLLLITAEGKGQTSDLDEYLAGAPELVVEVASSTDSIDLHAKLADYEACGVREYVVVVLRQQRVLWFVARDGLFVELSPCTDDIYRSEVFPGLWLDPTALLRHDGQRVREVLQHGLATPEHAAFVAKLAAAVPPQP